MSLRHFGRGEAFTISDHAAMAAWMKHPVQNWPRIQVALNAPETPELLGVTLPECNTPSFIMWRTETGVVITPFEANYVREYTHIEEALEALESWWNAHQAGQECQLEAPKSSCL